MTEHNCTKCRNNALNQSSIEADIRTQVRKLSRTRISSRAAVETKAKIVELKERLSGNRAWHKQHLAEMEVAESRGKINDCNEKKLAV